MRRDWPAMRWLRWMVGWFRVMVVFRVRVFRM